MYLFVFILHLKRSRVLWVSVFGGKILYIFISLQKKNKYRFGLCVMCFITGIIYNICGYEKALNYLSGKHRACNSVYIKKIYFFFCF